jgi:hypothetical protein
MTAQHLRSPLTAVSVAALALALVGTAPASAGDAAPTSPYTIGGNIDITTNYMFRGVSQTGNGPAIQGGFTFTYNPLNLNLGIWGSNVDGSSGTSYWTAPNAAGEQVVVAPDTPGAQENVLSAPGYSGANMETDFTASWTPTWDKIGLDLGYVRYEYFNTDYTPNNTNEFHLGASYDFGVVAPKATVSYSDNFFGFGSAWYYDLTIPVKLPYDFTLTGHYGWNQSDNSPNHGGYNNYQDYSVALSHDFIGLSFTLAWIDRTNVNDCVSPFDCGSTAVFTVSKSF